MTATRARRNRRFNDPVAVRLPGPARHLTRPIAPCAPRGAGAATPRALRPAARRAPLSPHPLRFRAQGVAARGDLLPVKRTRRGLVASVFRGQNEHEEEPVQRRADRRVLEAGRSGRLYDAAYTRLVGDCNALRTVGLPRIVDLGEAHTIARIAYRRLRAENQAAAPAVAAVAPTPK